MTIGTEERLRSALADRYRIEREIGAGGMATVYLAQDLRHDRRVALKVLRAELAAVIGAERFLAEIKLTANLQHPHILPLLDSGEAGQREDGSGIFLWYTMPYVEGESLRARISREKQLPVDEAVRLATEVASALDYAHRHGVIHRDIKPENVLLHEGQALVADFGIALALSSAGTRMTETGMSLGTPHYMSPEQAMGERELTARSDVYALGAMLYEMLVGEPPFTGPTAQAIVARVVTESPRPLLPQRHTIPPQVEAAVMTALEKLPADRFGSAAEFAEALTSPTAAMAASQRGTTVLRTAFRGRGLWNPLAIAATAVAVVAGAAALWLALRPTPRPVTRMSLAFAAGERPSQIGFLRLAIAPDGRRFVYAGPGEGGSQLWLRELDKLRATPIVGTEGGVNPFFSPDGRQIGYFDANTFALRIASLAGGPPVTLVERGNSGGGGAWSLDGYIYFDTNDGLRRIKATGGAIEPAVALDSSQAELGHAWPDVLPKSRGLIYRLRHVGQDPREYDIKATDLRTGKSKVLVRGVLGRYVEPGYLVYVTAEGDLLAAPFDEDRLEMTGPPTPLLEGIGVRGLGGTDVVISRSGDLMYITGASGGIAEMVWVGRDGVARPVDPGWNATGVLASLALSPDGRQLAIGVIGGVGGEDLWVKQLDAGPLSRLTFDGGTNLRPSWSPDGRFVLYTGADSTLGLLRKRADGSGAAEPLVHFPTQMAENLMSRDGRWIVTRSITGIAGEGDIYGFRPGLDTAATLLVATKFRETSPALSPDGRWLAYSSNESGRLEVYVRPFPDAATARWQVSVAGGTEPRWAHSGRELFYRNGAGDLIAAEVRGVPAFAVVQQQRLFAASSYFSLAAHFGYEVGPDDRRFLMARLERSEEGSEVVLVQNWREELKRIGKR
ncbi:MAG TPA: LpqB family beta-propeller domain-containing protein [Gemmatimonadales bacterium]|nr:LpqB family beta-propeller domain-containing protein [Gemmatimonadales bacterium]